MNSLLNTDGYKVGHKFQYPKNTEYVYSNWTPRKSRVQGITSVVHFGLQHFIKKWLVDDFNNNFFNKDKGSVVAEYKRLMDNYLGKDSVSVTHIEALHDLGYLPLKIKSLPEGSLVPMKCPAITIVNTIPEFYWLTNYIETLMSAELWGTTTSATIAREYKKLLTYWCEKTGGDREFIKFQAHDFSMRGMYGVDAAKLSGMGHLTSFVGTDTIPAIVELERYYGANSDTQLVGCSVPACYDNETEILTNEGWKFFEDLNKTELVAQYDEGGHITFVKPLEYFKDRYKGKMIKFKKSKGYKYIDAVVTPNHKMVRLKSENDVDYFEAGDFSYKNRNGFSHRNNIIISGMVQSSTKKRLSALDRLKIAFQADGSFPSHKEDYNGSKNLGFPIRFSLKKERKKDRLEYLLKSANIQYTLSEYENGYYSFWANVPEPFVKDFSWVQIDTIGYEECLDFIEELQYWDGTLKNNCIVYSTTDCVCVDVVQAICAISNHKTQFNRYIDERTDCERLPIYTLTIQKSKSNVTGANVVRESVDYDDYVYCVSVPSKMIVVRRNNVVLVCGNTEHAVMCSGGQENEIETFRRLIEDVYPTGIVSVVSDSWDLWKVCTEYLPRLKDKILVRNGKLVIRPDSGDPVDIICGHNISVNVNDLSKIKERFVELGFEIGIDRFTGKLITNNNIYYQIQDEDFNILQIETPKNPAIKGVVELLWEVFGGTINEKGFKVLDPHIGTIYGDSITLDRANQICERLAAKGFCSTNVVFGIGSYTYQYNTRDTFGFAMKATWCQIDGIGYNIFKNPVTDDGTKKSAKGLLRVVLDTEKNEYFCIDEVGMDEEDASNCLQTVFYNGTVVKEQTLGEIRGLIEQGM